ncbi:protein BASIC PENTACYSTEINE2-like [Impatiens glandulifera]|uniref:protein BASIC PENTACYSTEINE2-like n=1 Tax=Impatiens glandulifera TaxID=253017 RepID=UPI001FB09E20|nr:protein BASIC PENTACYSTEINE2-like [Impatiens glandulifera]
MDDDALNMRNWGYYEPSFKGNLGLQLMSTVAEPLPNVKQQQQQPLFTNHQPAFINHINNGHLQPRDCVVSEPSNMQLNYLRDNWINQQRDRFPNIFPLNPNFNVLPIQPPPPPSSSSVAQHHMQILSTNDPPPPTLPPHPTSVVIEENEGGSNLKKNKRNSSSNRSPKVPKPKKSKKSPKENGNSSSVERIKPAVKKSMDMVINGMNMDISTIPIPVCSCTSAPQQCYRWGCGGWQSACCTTTISIHPLPMSTKRRGARIAGRKMSQGAFKKVLEKLASEGYDFGNPIDLRNHWAKHGTNKFVTIR